MDKEEHNRTSKIHFYPIGLGARNEVLEPNKGRQLKVYSWRGGNHTIPSMKIATLSSIYQMLSQMHGGEAIIDYLKIDIDWEEWSVIPELIESRILDRVRQFGMEIHLTIEGNPNMTEYRKQAKILQRLEKEGGMVRFDSQINGISKIEFKNMGNVTGYYAYELAWYNNKYYHH